MVSSLWKGRKYNAHALPGDSGVSNAKGVDDIVEDLTHILCEGVSERVAGTTPLLLGSTKVSMQSPAVTTGASIYRITKS